MFLITSFLRLPGMAGARPGGSVLKNKTDRFNNGYWRTSFLERSVKHIDLGQKKELFAYGGLADNAAGSRSSSALRNARVSWAVEFG